VTAALWLATRRPAWVAERPRQVVLLTALSCLLAGGAIVQLDPLGVRLSLDPSSEPLLPRGDPAREAHARATEEFGDDQVYVIACETADIFTREHLLALKRTTDAIDAIDGVRRAKSLTDIVSFRFDAEMQWIDIGRFMTDVPRDPRDIAKLRERALADPLYRNSLVSSDGRVAAIEVSFQPMSDAEFIASGLDGRIARILERESSPERRFYMTGRPHVKAHVYGLMVRDLSWLIPLSLIVVGFVLHVALGSWRLALLPLGAVAVATLWTFAWIALAGTPLTILTIVLAPTLVAIGSAYSVHVLARLDEARAAGASTAIATAEALGALRSPVVIAGATTAIGYAAVSITDVPAVRDLGIISIFGVLSLTLVCLTALPAAAMLLGEPTRAQAPRLTRIYRSATTHLLDRSLAAATRRPGWIIAGWAAAVAVSLLLVPRTVVDTDYLSYLAADSPVRVDFETVDRLLAGASPLFVVVHGGVEGAFREPSTLAAMEALQARLDAVEGVSHSLSVMDFLHVLNRVVNEDDPAFERLPETRPGVAELLFMLPKTDLSRVANVNHSRINIVLRSGAVGSSEVNALVRRLESAIARESLPAGVRVELVGKSILLGRSADAIASGQRRTIAATTLAIFALISWTLRSPRAGALAMIPNLVPVAIFYGLLGAGAAPLSLPTSLIASVALGIAVDDTAHYLLRYRSLLDRGLPPSQALEACHHAIGRPIILSTTTLCAGYLTLTLSSFTTLTEFALLSTTTMLTCLATDLLLLPALLTHTHRTKSRPTPQSTVRPTSNTKPPPASTHLALVGHQLHERLGRESLEAN
jgi:predicted RND superfamily exporter protein